jgi:hypothetical protein
MAMALIERFLIHRKKLKNALDIRGASLLQLTEQHLRLGAVVMTGSALTGDFHTTLK